MERINVGPRMSDVIIHNGVAYLSGKTPTNPTEGAEEQTRDVLETIDKLLQAAGTSKNRILRAEILLSDIGDFEAMNRAWEAWIPANETPTRVTSEAKLARPDYRVEITVIAAL